MPNSAFSRTGHSTDLMPDDEPGARCLIITSTFLLHTHAYDGWDVSIGFDSEMRTRVSLLDICNLRHEYHPIQAAIAPWVRSVLDYWDEWDAYPVTFLPDPRVWYEREESH